MLVIAVCIGLQLTILKHPHFKIAVILHLNRRKLDGANMTVVWLLSKFLHVIVNLTQQYVREFKTDLTEQNSMFFKTAI